MKKLILASLLLLLLPIQSVIAQEDWEITTFDSQIRLQSDGQVRVVETIIVDFGTLEKHGIFREIPIDYQTPNGQSLYTRIDVNSVTANSEPIPFEQSTKNGYLILKIGDPDQTVTGTQKYALDYLATGVVSVYESYDELYWNVTGTSWPVPISKTSATVTLPSDALLQTACYQGPEGAQEPCTLTQTKREIRASATRALSAGENLTISAGFTKGLVPALTVSKRQRVNENPFTSLPLWVLGLIGAVPVLVSLLLAFRLWSRQGRDLWWRRRFPFDPEATHEVKPWRAHVPVVVEFDPPEKLRPAEIGVLMDEKADTLDVTATILDLANRGYLTIHEEEKGWFGGKDYTLKKLRPAKAALLEYEQLLLDKLFASGPEVKISSLKNKFYKDLKIVKEKLYEDLTKKGYFPKNPETVRQKYLAIFIVLLVVGILGLSILGAVPPLAAFGAGLLGSSFIFLILSFVMPRRSALGHDLYTRARGYELFITKAEKYRQQLFERKNLFNGILPYAIVFGATKKFAAAFEDLGIQPSSPGWYSGTGSFHPALFAAQMNSFSSSVSSTMAKSPSSSGSGGGGFSGGGFGGGGGGSW